MGTKQRRAVGSDRNHPVPEQRCSRPGLLVSKSAARVGAETKRGEQVVVDSDSVQPVRRELEAMVNRNFPNEVPECSPREQSGDRLCQLTQTPYRVQPVRVER